MEPNRLNWNKNQQETFKLYDNQPETFNVGKLLLILICFVLMPIKL